MNSIEKIKTIIFLVEAMGWTISQEWPNFWVNPAGETVTEGLLNTFNPIDSDADFWAAVDEICGHPRKITITKCVSGDHEVEITSQRSHPKWFRGTAQTYLEAGCLALAQHIKEKQKRDREKFDKNASTFRYPTG